MKHFKFSICVLALFAFSFKGIAQCGYNFSMTVFNEKCKGDKNGYIAATLTGGVSPYTYNWSNGATTATISALSVGVYSVTVSDNSGCQDTASGTITEPPLLGDPSIVTNISCFAGNNGSISITGSGGTAPYTYLYAWSNGFTGNPDVGLTAGSYSCIYTITDAHGCVKSTNKNFTVTQPAQLTAGVTINSQPSCYGGMGKITATKSGGNAPYTYLWSNGVSTAAASNLPAGTYSVTVTDNNGCTATASAALTQPAQLTLSVSSASPCFGAVVTLNSSVSGGVAPYSYAWTPAAALNSSSAIPNPTFIASINKTFTLSVQDNQGCSVSATITENIDKISASVASASMTCSSYTTGSLAATVSGAYAAAPYTYLWSNGATNATATGLSVGTYSVIVTDANGCSSTASNSVTAQNQSPTVIVTSSSDFIDNGGSDVLTAAGANTYLWSNGSTANPLVVSPTATTTYTVTGTNTAGCTATATTTVTVLTQDVWLQNGNNIYYNGGNVGINTSTPTSALQVNGNITDNGSITATNLKLQDTMVVPLIQTHRIELMPGDSLIRFGDSTIIMNLNNDNIYSYSGGFVCTTCNPTYFGIALGYPNTVIGTSSNFSTNSIAVGTYNNVSNGSLAIGSGNLLNNSAMAFGFSNTSSISSITIGAGITNNIANSIMLGISTTHNPALTIIPDPTNTIAGLIGIATTSPIAQFQINNNINSISMGSVSPQSPFYLETYLGFNAARSAAGSWTVGTDGSSNGGVAIIGDAMGGLNFATIPNTGSTPQTVASDAAIQNNIVMHLTANGYLGIGLGTNFPAYPLDINGNAHIAGNLVVGNGLNTPGNYGLYVGNGILTSMVKIATVNSADWSDYVFDKEYKLKPLNDLYQYIKGNKHLPDVPSAEDVKKNGVNIAEMDAILLKKVEESTLYIIDLKKQLDEQQNQLDEMKAEIKKLKESK